MSIPLGREIKFTEVLEKLTQWRQELVEQMRNPSTTQQGREDVLKLKSQVDQAIACLQLCERYQISLNAKVTEVPTLQQEHLSAYHLIDSCFSTEPQNGKPVEVNSKPLVITPGDLIIRRSGDTSYYASQE